jgi:hypothetical protein
MTQFEQNRLEKRQCCGEAATMQINYYSNSVCTAYQQQWNIVNWYGCANYYVANARSWNIAGCAQGLDGQCQAQFWEMQDCSGGSWPWLYSGGGGGSADCNNIAYWAFPAYSAYVVAYT